MRRSPLLFIFITVFVDLLGYGMMLPLLPFYVAREGGTASLVGALGSTYALMQLLSAPVLGALSDRFGRRPVLLICLLGTAGAYVLLGFANSLAFIFLAIALDGITGGNLTTAQAYIADLTSPDQRARGLGLVGAALGLGLMAGPALGGVLSLWAMAAPAFVAATIAFSNVVFGFFVLPESHPPEKRVTQISLATLNPLAQFKNILAYAPALLLTLFLLNLSFAGLQTNFPLYTQARFSWDAWRNGLFFAYVGVCSVFTQGFLVGKLQPRFGETKLTLFGLTLMGVMLASITFVPSGEWLYGVVGLLALGSGLSIPSLTSLISRQLGEAEQGKILGSTNALLSLNMILGPALAGFAADSFGIFAPYWLGSVLALGALGVMMRAKFTQRENQ